MATAATTITINPFQFAWKEHVQCSDLLCSAQLYTRQSDNNGVCCCSMLCFCHWWLLMFLFLHFKQVFFYCWLAVLLYQKIVCDDSTIHNSYSTKLIQFDDNDTNNEYEYKTQILNIFVCFLHFFWFLVLSSGAKSVAVFVLGLEFAFLAIFSTKRNCQWRKIQMEWNNRSVFIMTVWLRCVAAAKKNGSSITGWYIQQKIPYSTSQIYFILIKRLFW